MPPLSGWSWLAFWRPLLKRARTGDSSKKKGDALEERVVSILKLEGRTNIRRTVFVKDGFGHRSEIDVKCGYLWPTYFECKNYSGMSVPLEDVAKFKEVLKLNGVNPRRGVFVTTSTFSPRATTIGIRTVDGKQLDAWHRRAAAMYPMRMAGRIAMICALVAALAVAAAPTYVALGLPGCDAPIARAMEQRHFEAVHLGKRAVRVAEDFIKAAQQ